MVSISGKSLSTGICAGMLAACCIGATNAVADDFWNHNTRVALDVAARGMYEADGDNSSAVLFYGVDSHRVFSGRYGDVGTLLVQIYATTLRDVEAYPAVFDDKDDTQIIYRNVNFNYTALFQNRLNFRVGHFEVPFGLEQVINTNGTLRDYLHGRNIGVKGDWGAAINGDLRHLEYEVAWTRGSGNDWDNGSASGVFAGRVGTRRSRNWMVGLSFLDGEVHLPAAPDDVRSLDRVGIDGRYLWRRLEFLGEISAGEDNGSDVVNGLLEVDLQSADASWLTYMQLRHFRTDLDTGDEDATSLTFGVKYEPDNRWTLSADYTHDFETFSGVTEKNLWRGQLRYRFE